MGSIFLFFIEEKTKDNMKLKSKRMFLLILFSFLIVNTFASPTEGEFFKRSLTLNGKTYNYRIYVPQNYNSEKKYPIVLYLHGSDERGKGNEIQVESGLPRIIRIGSRLGEKEFSSFIGVFPQCPENNFWIGENADQALKALDETIGEFSIDSQRVYLTGFSMGGYGTWYLAAKYPQRFAAIVPIGGHIVPAFLKTPMKMPPMLKDAMHSNMLPLYESSNPYKSFAEVIGKTPAWIFHGEKDNQVPISDAREMVKAIKEVNPRAKYTEYKGSRHFIYDKAYTEKGFWKWLLSKKLNKKGTKYKSIKAQVYLQKSFVNLTNSLAGEYEPMWSPDSKKIAFYSDRNPEGKCKYKIFIMNSDGSNQKQLKNSNCDFRPVFSPDGKKLAFDSGRDGNHEIYTVNIDGTNLKRLTNSQNYDSSPRWSPDGKRIVYFSGSIQKDYGNSDIFLMNSDGTNKINLTKNERSDTYPMFSPDGKKIVFTSYRDGNAEIYVMNSDGSNQMRLTNNLSRDDNPRWSSDGKQIGFGTNRDGNYEIYVMDIDGKNKKNISKHSSNDVDISWSPNAKKIAFASKRTGNYEIFLMSYSRKKKEGLSLAQKQKITDVLKTIAIDYLKSWELPFNPAKTLTLFTKSKDFQFVNDGYSITKYDEWAKGIPKYMSKDASVYKTYKHKIKDIKALALSNNSGVVTVTYNWNTVTKGGVIKSINGAITLTCRKEEDGWKIVHYHGSHSGI